MFDRALTLLLQDLERKKLADARRPRPALASKPGSRHVPAAVRRDVWKRDAGQCAFVGDVRRCTERGFLEFHHVVPFAEGGPATVENLELRCRAHNVHEAKQHFGPLFVREEQCPYSSFRNERTLTLTNPPMELGKLRAGDSPNSIGHRAPGSARRDGIFSTTPRSAACDSDGSTAHPPA